MNYSELFITISVETPLINLIVSSNSKRSCPTSSHYFNLLLPNEEWHNLWLQYTLLWFFFLPRKLVKTGDNTIDLPVHVEAPPVQI
jgi:hypothetical protein